MMEGQLNELKNRFKDLSLHNRSIRLLKLDKKWAMDLLQLDQDQEDGTAEKVIKGILSRREKVSLLRIKGENQRLQSLSHHLTMLYQTLKEVEEETGLYDLYLGYPFLSGTLEDGTYIQAPLFLYPVRLERQDSSNRFWRLHRGEGGPQLNRTLMLALNTFHSFQVEDSIYEEAEKESLKGDITQWTQWLRDLGLHLSDPNPDILPLPEYKKDELPDQAPLTLNRHAVLGHFPQGMSAILKDCQELMSMDTKELGMVGELLQAGTDRLKDGVSTEEDEECKRELPEKERFYLLPFDVSQERILLNAREKKTLVIDDPPGTGRSQMIVNLIGDALSQRKKVLLVSPKRAALDGVYQRLDGLGMSKYTALVHDEKADRKKVYTQIYHLLSWSKESLSDPTEQFESLCQRLEDQKAKLDAVQKGLYEPHRSGYHAHELYSRVQSHDQLKDVIDLSGFLNKLDRHSLEDVLQEVSTYASFYQRFGQRDYPLNKRQSFASLDHQSFTFIRERLDNIYRKAKKAEEYLRALHHPKITPAYTWLVSDRLEKVYSTLGIQKKNIIHKIRFWWWRSFAGKEIIQKLLQGNSFPGTTSTSEWTHIQDSLRVMYDLAQITEQMKQEMDQLQPYFQDNWIQDLKNAISEGNVPSSKLLQVIQHFDSDFADLREMDRFLEQTSSLAREMIAYVHKQIGWQAEGLSKRWTEAIRQNAYVQWLDEIEKQYPMIANISSDEYEEIRQSYKELLQEKREIARKCLLRNISQRVEQRKKEFPKAVKELRHQVGKKRLIWPLRKLVRQFSGSGLLEIVPVWLTNPETLSSIFPLEKGMFDMVIIDEASQCRVEDGLPSAFRGKQVIVAGDERQLPNSDYFQDMMADDEEKPGFEMEASESLLRIAQVKGRKT